MTQYPNQPMLYGGAPGPYQPAAKKPAAITVVAISAIIFGSLGLLCCGLPNLSTPIIGGGRMTLPDNTVYQTPAPMLVLQVVFGALDLVTSLLLLTVGIAALTLKPWSRSFGVILSVVIVALVVVKFGVTFTYTLPESRKLVERLKEAAEAKGGKEAEQVDMIAKVLGGGTVIAGVVVAVLQLLTPALILLFWTKVHIKAWFQPPVYPPAGIAPPGYPPT